MIDFIAACDRGLEFYSDDETETVERSDTIEGCVAILRKYGLSANGYFSSSMDFADEYGFDHRDDARHLWGEVIKTYRDELPTD